MAKKTKKRNPQQLKAEQAHQKNQYLKRIKEMMGILGCPEAWDLLTQAGIELFHRFHIRPVKFINPAEELVFQKKDLEKLNKYFTYLLKSHHLQVGPEKKEVSYYDFYTFIETIHLFWRNCHELKFPEAPVFKAMFKSFNNGFQEVREQVYEEISKLTYTLSWLMSDLTRYMIWIEHLTPQETPDLKDFVFHNNHLLHVQIPEQISIELDNVKRTAYRVGMIVREEGIVWKDIKPEKLGMEGILNPLPLKIYIQAHAIERIKERLGSFVFDLHSTLILTSLFEEIIIPAQPDGFLFTVRYSKLKIGYLKADVVGDALIIRTFLFLTNNGTPEGKKLEELLGLQKEDKKYLGIDKLDTFIYSDIEQNPQLKELFVKADCGDLFKLKNQKSEVSDTKQNCANYIIGYLGLDKKEPVCMV